MPDLSDIYELAKGLSTEVFGPFLEQCARCDALYEGDIKVPVPEGQFHKHVPPTARAKVDALVDHTIVSHPAIIVTTTRKLEKSNDQADALEQGCDALWQRLNAERPHNLARDLAKLSIMHGVSFIKGPLWLTNPYEADLRRRRAESLESFTVRQRVHLEKHKHHMPIHMRAVPATNILWQPGHWPQEWVIEMSTLPYKRANTLYNLSLDGKLGTEALLLEYWDIDMRATIILDTTDFGNKDLNWFAVSQKWDGARYTKRRNPDDNVLGFIPYRAISAGFGRPSRKPEDEFKGILKPADSTIVAEARLKTALEARTEAYALPVLLVEEDMAGVKMGTLGDTVVVPEGGLRKIGFRPVPPENPELLRTLAFQLDDVQRYLGTDALVGVRAAGEVTIGQQATRIGQGALKVQTLLESLNTGMSGFFFDVFRLIDVMGESIPVWGVQGTERLYQVIQPGELGDFSPHLSFEPVSPEMEDRRTYLAIALHNAGLLDDETIRERFLKEKDNTTITRKLLLQRVLLHPLIQQALGLMGLQEAGMDDIAGMAQQLGVPQGAPEAGGRELRESDLVKRFKRMQGPTVEGGLRTTEEIAPFGGRA